MIELYLGLHRIVKKEKYPKWRESVSIMNINSHTRHETCCNIIQPKLIDLIRFICVIDQDEEQVLADKNIGKFIYDDCQIIHLFSHNLNQNTRSEFLKEIYEIGTKNDILTSKATIEKFNQFKQVSQRYHLTANIESIGNVTNENKENTKDGSDSKDDKCINDNANSKNNSNNNSNNSGRDKIGNQISEVFDKFKFSLPVNVLLHQKRSKCQKCNRKCYLYCAYCMISMPIVMNHENENKNENENDKKMTNHNSSNDGSSDMGCESKHVQNANWKNNVVDELVSGVNNNNVSYLPEIEKLPIKIDIIRHGQELLSVCSSVHACVICPNDVKMYEYPNIPDYNDISYNINNSNTNSVDENNVDCTTLANENVYLLYPSENSVYLDELSIEEISQISKLIVIESKWHGNGMIYNDKRLKNVKHCKIRNHETLYWRYQEYGNEYLSTIEAIYYSIVDVWINKYKCKNINKNTNKNTDDECYQGQFDDLLLLFAHNHSRIRKEIAKSMDINRRNGNNVKQLPKLWNKELSNVKCSDINVS